MIVVLNKIDQIDEAKREKEIAKVSCHKIFAVITLVLQYGSLKMFQNSTIESS